MKRILHLCTLVFAVCVSLVAQNDSVSVYSKLNLANEMYSQGQYSDAASLYEDVLENGISAQIYYNLGNSYFKADEIGLAILNYERALRLYPGFSDAEYNLKIAESKIIDNINSAPTFFMKRWLTWLVNNFSSNQWAYISLFFYVLALSLFLCFVFSFSRRRRKITFNLTIVAALLLILSFSFSAIRKDQFVRHNSAIILSGSVTAKSAPDLSGTDLFQLHEGTKVNVKGTIGSWTEISLENGAVGWIEESNMARI